MTTIVGVLLIVALVAMLAGLAALWKMRRLLHNRPCGDRGRATQRYATEVAHRSAEHRSRLYEEMESIRRGRRDDGA
jgi:hypothetical protein